MQGKVLLVMPHDGCHGPSTVAHAAWVDEHVVVWMSGDNCFLEPLLKPAASTRPEYG